MREDGPLGTDHVLRSPYRVAKQRVWHVRLKVALGVPLTESEQRIARRLLVRDHRACKRNPWENRAV